MSNNRRFYLKFITVTILTLMIGSYALVKPSPSQAATISTSNSSQHMKTPAEMQAWVNRVSPYIHISGTYVATLDAAAYTHLSKQDISDTLQALKTYNMLPTTSKSPHMVQSVDKIPSFSIQPYANLCSVGSVRIWNMGYQWWGGTQYWLNDCFIYWAAPGNLALLGGIGVLMAITCTSTVVCGVLAAVIGAVLGIDYWALDHDTNACNHRGAYLNIMNNGAFWPAPVC